jgi:hypothetical protein
MTVKSKVYARDQVDNKNPRAKADTKYYVAYFVDLGGATYPLLFTDFDIEKARKRAAANTEDVPAERVSFWKRLFS